MLSIDSANFAAAEQQQHCLMMVSMPEKHQSLRISKNEGSFVILYKYVYTQ